MSSLRIFRIIETMFDYHSMMAFKHAHNLVQNEERLILTSLKQRPINNLKKTQPIVITNDEIEWLNKLSIKQSLN